MPLFNKPIIIKSNGKEKYIFTGYNIFARNKIQCKQYYKFTELNLKHLLHIGEISQKQHDILLQGSKQWCQDETHPVIQFEYYDIDTNIKYTSCHYITRQEAGINRKPTLMEYNDGKNVENENPLKISNNLYVTIYGAITDINSNDAYSNFFNLDMDLQKLTFDEEKGFYVGPDGTHWSNLTKENTNLICKKLIKKFQDDGVIRKYDKTDNLYTHNAILKVKVLEKNLSTKDPEQIDQEVTKIENKLKIYDHLNLIPEVENSNSLINKKGSDFNEKSSTGIIDEE